MITAVVVEKRPVAQVVRDYGVSRSWVYELLVRYKADGEAAFDGRPHAGTHVLLLAQDLRVRVINAATGELPRELTIAHPRLPAPTPDMTNA